MKTLKTHRIRSTKAERREKKKRPKMAVSGRSVFLLQRIRGKIRRK